MKTRSEKYVLKMVLLTLSFALSTRAFGAQDSSANSINKGDLVRLTGVVTWEKVSALVTRISSSKVEVLSINPNGSTNLMKVDSNQVTKYDSLTQPFPDDTNHIQASISDAVGNEISVGSAVQLTGVPTQERIHGLIFSISESGVTVLTITKYGADAFIKVDRRLITKARQIQLGPNKCESLFLSVQ